MVIVDNRQLTRARDIPAGGLFIDSEGDVLMMTNEDNERDVAFRKAVLMSDGMLLNISKDVNVKKIDGTLYIED